VPKHRQVYGALRDAILEGKLKADDPLPSTRELATALGVSRNTAMAAYELLLAEGYVVGRGGAGTFVAHDAIRSRPAERSDEIEPRPLSMTADILRVNRVPAMPTLARPFSPSSPAPDAFPYATWSRIIGRVARGGTEWLNEGNPKGYLPLRKAIAQHLQTVRTCQCDPEQIIIVTGSQLAMFLCSMLLIDPGAAVWIEEPGYPQARLAFRTRTDRVIPVPIDASGMNIAAGKELSPNPQVIHVTPTHQWPFGFTMSVQRRLELLEFAAARGAWIIEDDYNGDLRFDRRTYSTLYGLDDANRVLHLGTFSKTMYPGLRIGYVVVPPDLVESFVAGHRLLDRYPNTIAQMAMAEFLETGSYARHVYEMQSLYRERHELLRSRIMSKLSGIVEARTASAGTFTTTELVAGIDDVALADALRRRDIDCFPLSSAYAGPPGKHGLLLGHAVATPENIRKGVDAMEQVVAQWMTSTKLATART
jgi:GntR family transcriptional regulator/MocR family aminotransferase